MPKTTRNMRGKSPRKRCTHVRQRAPYWCVQACLESFLADNRVSISQEEMVRVGTLKKTCVANGVIPDDPGKKPSYRNLIDFCALFGIEVKKVKSQRIPPRLHASEGILVATWNYK